MYSRRDLVHAYLAEQRRGYGNYLVESSAYNDALATYYAGLLDGLQHLFGLSLRRADRDASGNPAVHMLFGATADSMLSIRTPWSGFLEAGLIHRRLAEAGPDGERVAQASESIRVLAADARAAHLEMLDALVTILLAGRAGRTFTDADLLAAGADLAEPNPASYPLYGG